MKPLFADDAAHRRWDQYFAIVDALLIECGREIADLREDLERHVIDSLAAQPALGSEVERLNMALDRLGEPVDYLRPLLADALIERGTRTYSPVTIAQGLFHAGMAGARGAVVALFFGLGYLLLAVFGAIVLLKPFWADHVGLFRHGDGSFSAGIVRQVDGAHELLGWSTAPIALGLAAGLYVLLTKGLRAVRRSG